MNAKCAIPLILAAALTASGQSGGAIPASFFGISALGGTFPVPTTGVLAHPDFAWAELEPSPGNFDFSRLDAYVSAAGQHGLVDPTTNTASIAFTLSKGAPDWAGPDNLQDWKDFVTALLQHYDGVNAPHIRYYELWSEANQKSSWTGTTAQLVAMAKAAYAIVHLDRNSLLLTPSVSGTGQTSWMTTYLQAGGGQYADGAAFHGYLASGAMPEQDIAGMATQLRPVLDTWGMAGKPLLETEGNWGTANLDASTQTAWLARYLLLLAGVRPSTNLQMAGWYAWSSAGTPGNLADGNMQPTAAGTAYSELYKWLAGATITKPCSGIANGTWTCSFTRPGGYVAQAVWNTQGYINYTPGLGYVQYRDLAGKTTLIPPDAFIDVSPQPVLIEGAATGSIGYPVISLVANAEGETPFIAPNMWVEIKGTNLARAGDSRIWQGTDFVNNQMPHLMDGVSVTVNGKSAYLYYVSPSQVNILTPPDAISGNVPVQITVNGIPSPAVMVRCQTIAPSFFVFGGGPYVAAEHANGKYLGPTSLYAGLTTPAKPGEIVVFYANGFGATDTAVQAGLPVQSGELTSLPSVMIGGVNAQVLYAALIGPGEFQFNVIVPGSLSAGDQPVTATYKGFSTQPGVVISVQP